MKAPYTAPAALAAAVLSVAASALAQAPSPEAPTFRVVLTSQVNGQFTDLRCGDGGSLFQRLSRGLAGAPEGLRIDAGDLLGSATTTRLAAETNAPGLARAVASLGYHALAVGHRDLAAERQGWLRAVAALRAEGVPVVLSNLHCEPDHRALCEAIADAGDPPLVVTTPAGPTGVVVLMNPALLTGLAGDRREGLRLDALDEALPREVGRVRAAGARRVVVVLDPGSEASLPSAIAAGQHFEGTAPDLVVVNELPEGVASLVTARAEVPVVAAHGAYVSIVTPGAPRLLQRAPEEHPAPESVNLFIQSTGRWLCETYHRALPGGAVEGIRDRERFARYFLDVVRDVTRSEVALINRPAVRDLVFPLEGALTELDVLATLPFADTLQRAQVTGAALRALVTGPALARVYLQGVTVEGTAVRVNGRTLDDTARYTVVTTGFVARAGTVGGSPSWARVEAWGGPQELFLGWLRQAEHGAPSDPSRHTRWRFRLSLDTSYSDTRIQNPLATTYNDAQLTRAEAQNLRLDAEARADADHPSFTWENNIRTRYGLGRQVTLAGMDSGFLENLDVTTARTTFSYRAFARGRWFHPLPYLEGFLETELDRPTGMSARSFLHFQVRPTVGVRFEFVERWTLNLGAGLDTEIFDGSRGPQPVLVFGTAVRPGRLFSIGGRNAEWQVSAELAWRDPGGLSDAQLRTSVKVSVPLLERLALSFGNDVFGRVVGSNAVAVANDLTVGLKWTLDGSLQSFRW